MGKRKRAERRDGKPKDPFIERKAAALRALSQFQACSSLGELDPEVIDVLMQESDRGALILVAGILEDVLADQIIKRLKIALDGRDDLLRRGGALSSYQNKMSVARALGIIDDATFHSIDIIRLIRNACAHSVRQATLKTPAIRDMFCLVLADDVAGHIK